MAATKLGVFNAALGHLGERRLASLTEAREPRRVLEDFYTDVVGHCLERGNWKFAIRLLARTPHKNPPDFGLKGA